MTLSCFQFEESYWYTFSFNTMFYILSSCVYTLNGCLWWLCFSIFFVVRFCLRCIYCVYQCFTYVEICMYMSNLYRTEMLRFQYNLCWVHTNVLFARDASWQIFSTCSEDDASLRIFASLHWLWMSFVCANRLIRVCCEHPIKLYLWPQKIILL